MASDSFISAQIVTGEIGDKLAILKRRLEDLTPVYKEIGELMVLRTDDRFREEVDPNGIPWQQLSPYTIRMKQQQRRIMKILQSTGRLRASINYQADRRGVVIGTNVSYAKKHQEGGREGRYIIPPRPFLGIGDEDTKEILLLIEEYLNATNR